MRENRTYSLSGGRWPARKRATSDPTAKKRSNGGGAKGRRTKERSQRRNWRAGERADAGVPPGLDRETSAIEGACHQERDGEGLGTQVPGLSTGPQEADRDSTGSLERFKGKVREMWNGRRNRTSTQLREEWSRYVRGWWEPPLGGQYFQLAAVRRPIQELEPWVRRPIRKCFWLRWHDRAGRLRRLRHWGLCGPALGVATSRRGAWGVAKQPELHRALNNAILRRYGFLLPSDLAARQCRRVQPPDAENRTSGGVGGWRGAIPVARPDPGGPTYLN